MRHFFSLILSLSIFLVGFSPIAIATPLRIVAANISSGNNQSYDLGHGIRILKGLKPDIVLIQEWNYQDNSPQAMQNFIDEVFGENSGYTYFREKAAQIPNGVISRFPIIRSGEWNDDLVSNRDFAYAQIDIPGDTNLFAVSVHFLTRNATTRRNEAEDLISDMDGVVPSQDYLVIGGDFNTANHNELALKSLNRVVQTTKPYPVDQKGNGNTNASRRKPYDGIYVDQDLVPLEIPVKIGSESFDSGLVFDSRVYQPLSDLPSVRRSDSDAPQMQHMAVVRDFEIP